MDHSLIEFPWFPLVLGQVLRGVCIVVAPFCIILSYRLVRWSTMAGYRKRGYAGIALLLASAVYTQVDRWDDPVTPRLFFVTAGILLIFSTLLQMRDYEHRDV